MRQWVLLPGSYFSIHWSWSGDGAVYMARLPNFSIGSLCQPAYLKAAPPALLASDITTTTSQSQENWGKLNESSLTCSASWQLCIRYTTYPPNSELLRSPLWSNSPVYSKVDFISFIFLISIANESHMVICRWFVIVLSNLTQWIFPNNNNNIIPV